MREQTPLRALLGKYKRDFPEFLGLRATDINRKGYDDDTLLHLVVTIGTLEELDLLMAAGADVNAVGDKGYTPLHNAASRGSIEMVGHLLSLGADPTIRSEFDATPAETADTLGRPEIAAFIRGFSK